MTLAVSFDLKNARLSAVVAFLDTGATVARVSPTAHREAETAKAHRG